MKMRRISPAWRNWVHNWSLWPIPRPLCITYPPNKQNQKQPQHEHTQHINYPFIIFIARELWSRAAARLGSECAKGRKYVLGAGVAANSPQPAVQQCCAVPRCNQMHSIWGERARFMHTAGRTTLSARSFPQKACWERLHLYSPRYE